MPDQDPKAEEARRKFVEDLYKRGEVAEDEASMKPNQTHVKDPNAPGGVRRVRFTLIAPHHKPAL
ncbi:MAG: hypothetical protein JO121_30040 [Deltaproteobacteria bacterium]|jgi:hypothetical protein|nr:hypothetical protein [Deltaproteobacteria bacterium]